VVLIAVHEQQLALEIRRELGVGRHVDLVVRRVSRRRYARLCIRRHRNVRRRAGSATPRNDEPSVRCVGRGGTSASSAAGATTATTTTATTAVSTVRASSL